jgi:hypothetical protein
MEENASVSRLSRLSSSSLYQPDQAAEDPPDEYDELGVQVPEMQEANKVLSDRLQQKDAEIEDSLADLRRIDETFEMKQRKGAQEHRQL